MSGTGQSEEEKVAMDAAAKATENALASARAIGWPKGDRSREIEARLVAEAAVVTYLASVSPVGVEERKCDYCEGSGQRGWLVFHNARPSEPVPCPVCKGTGVLPLATSPSSPT